MRLAGAGLDGLARLSPPLAARIATTMMLRPPRYRLDTRESAWLDRAERWDVAYRHGVARLRQSDWLGYADREAIARQDGRVRLYRFGASGPPVVLVHGWGGSVASFSPWIDPLKRLGFMPVLLDLPAHGASSGRRTHAPQVASALLAVQSQLGPFAALIGHSFGGFAGLVAVMRGLETRRLVLVNAPTEPDVLIRGFQARLGLSGRLADAIRARCSDSLGLVFDELDPAGWPGGPGRSLLLIHDEEDARVEAGQGRRLAAAWPEARLLATRGLGHTRILANARVIDVACGFLRASGDDFAGRPAGQDALAG